MFLTLSVNISKQSSRNTVSWFETQVFFERQEPRLKWRM